MLVPIIIFMVVALWAISSGILWAAHWLLKIFSELIFISPWLYSDVDAGPDYNIHGRSSLSHLVRNIVGRSLIVGRLFLWPRAHNYRLSQPRRKLKFNPMPRGRNSELSRELRRSVLEKRQLAATIERELARQRRRVVHQEPYRWVEFRPVVRPYIPPERQPQQSVAHGGSVPPPPLRADEPPTQHPEIATFAHNAGAVARYGQTLYPGRSPCTRVSRGRSTTSNRRRDTTQRITYTSPGRKPAGANRSEYYTQFIV